MKYIDVQERLLLFSFRYFNASVRIHKANERLKDEIFFYNKLFKRYVINGQFEKARDLAECINNILLCFQ